MSLSSYFLSLPSWGEEWASIQPESIHHSWSRISGCFLHCDRDNCSLLKSVHFLRWFTAHIPKILTSLQSVFTQITLIFWMCIWVIESKLCSLSSSEGLILFSCWAITLTFIAVLNIILAVTMQRVCWLSDGPGMSFAHTMISFSAPCHQPLMFLVCCFS